MSKRILITGATGFLGYRTIEYLLSKEGYEIVAAARTKRMERIFEAPNLKYHFGDLSNADYVDQLFEEPITAVVNCASLSAPWGDLADFKLANIQTQALLISAAKRNAVQRFIYISSPSIYVNYKNRKDLTEHSQLEAPVNAYAATKREAEQLLRASGLAFVILRPRALIGRGDSIIFPRLLKAQKEGRLRRIGRGQNICDLTAVLNVASAIDLALKADGAALNQDYNITNGEPIHLWEVIDRVFQELGIPAVQKSVPFFMAYLVAGLSEWKAKIFKTKQEPALIRYSVATLAMDMTFDISKAKDLLGYQPLQSTEEALKEFIESIKGKPNVEV